MRPADNSRRNGSRLFLATGLSLAAHGLLLLGLSVFAPIPLPAYGNGEGGLEIALTALPGQGGGPGPASGPAEAAAAPQAGGPPAQPAASSRAAAGAERDAVADMGDLSFPHAASPPDTSAVPISPEDLPKPAADKHAPAIAPRPGPKLAAKGQDADIKQNRPVAHIKFPVAPVSATAFAAAADTGEGQEGGPATAAGPTAGPGAAAGAGAGTGQAAISPEPLGVAVNPKPSYPELARRRGQEGTVALLAHVDEKGVAQDVVVQRSSGYTLLDGAALRAVRQWRFKPARMAGAAVPGRVLVPVEFRLQ